MLELDDIQSFVFQAFGRYYRAWYAFLRFDPNSLEQNRRWLQQQSEFVTSVDAKTKRLERENKHYHVVIGFTQRGLNTLGVGGKHGEMYLRHFSEAFTEGMPYRAEVLGDVPEHWDWGNPSQGEPDVMVAMFARSSDFASQQAAFRKAYLDAGLQELKGIEGYTYSDLREHFGFTDGISQPLIEGFHDSIDTDNLCQPGEFILGYRNERQVYPESAVLKSANASGEFDLGKNGSFLVARQLMQDVEKFREDNSSELDAAKLIGRWRSGTPLTLCPHHDDIKLKANNSFSYHGPDRYGYRCPIGSHIRRSNPRDSKFSLDDNEDPAHTKNLGKRHRVIRRGRMYGPPVPDNFYSEPLTPDSKPVDEERGTLFLCLNASIETQFEFIMQNWINRKDFNGLNDEVDPLASVELQGPRNFTAPEAPGVQRRTVNQYVSMRGGCYLFLPGISALRYILGSVELHSDEASLATCL